MGECLHTQKILLNFIKDVRTRFSLVLASEALVEFSSLIEVFQNLKV